MEGDVRDSGELELALDLWLKEALGPELDESLRRGVAASKNARPPLRDVEGLFFEGEVVGLPFLLPGPAPAPFRRLPLPGLVVAVGL